MNTTFSPLFLVSRNWNQECDIDDDTKNRTLRPTYKRFFGFVPILQYSHHFSFNLLLYHQQILSNFILHYHNGCIFRHPRRIKPMTLICFIQSRMSIHLHHGTGSTTPTHQDIFHQPHHHSSIHLDRSSKTRTGIFLRFQNRRDPSSIPYHVRMKEGGNVEDAS